MSRSVYLAGPFFNKAELAIVEAVESLLASRPNIKCFSPRNGGGNAERQGDVKANAQRIFDTNVRAMRECHECVALLDRPQEPGARGECREIWLVDHVQYADPKRQDDLFGVRGPLEQPDLGTVWELGYLKAWRDMVVDLDVDLTIPSIWAGRKVLAGFTKKPRGAAGGKQNVMLARCLDVVIHGFAELEHWFSYPTAGVALDDFKAAGFTTQEGDVE